MLVRVKLDDTLPTCDQGNDNQTTVRSRNRTLVTMVRDTWETLPLCHQHPGVLIVCSFHAMHFYIVQSSCSYSMQTSSLHLSLFFFTSGHCQPHLTSSHHITLLLSTLLYFTSRLSILHHYSYPLPRPITCYTSPLIPLPYILFLATKIFCVLLCSYLSSPVLFCSALFHFVPIWSFRYYRLFLPYP